MTILYRIQDGCPVLLLEAVPTEAIAPSDQRRVRDVKLRAEGDGVQCPGDEAIAPENLAVG